jgi:hypothetical protein
MLNKFKKFFKKLTLFDRILISVGILAIVVFAYLFLRRASYLTITLKVGPEDVYSSIYGQGIPVWFENHFSKGLKEKNGLGTVQAEVLDLNSFSELPQKRTLYLKIKLRVTYNRASDTFTYKGTPVVIGTKLKLYLSGLLVDGLVTEMDGIKDQRERKVLTVDTKIIDENHTYAETSGTKDYLADSVNVGDEIKDINGNTILKVISKRVEPAKKITTTANGGLTVQRDPIRKDVYLTLQLNAVKIKERYFVYDDIPVLVDHAIPINTPITLIYTTVTKVTNIQ